MGYPKGWLSSLPGRRGAARYFKACRSEAETVSRVSDTASLRPSLSPTAATRSLEIAVEGFTPNSRISIGVITGAAPRRR